MLVRGMTFDLFVFCSAWVPLLAATLVVASIWLAGFSFSLMGPWGIITSVVALHLLPGALVGVVSAFAFAGSLVSACGFCRLVAACALSLRLLRE